MAVRTVLRIALLFCCLFVVAGRTVSAAPATGEEGLRENLCRVLDLLEQEGIPVEVDSAGTRELLRELLRVLRADVELVEGAEAVREAELGHESETADGPAVRSLPHGVSYVQVSRVGPALPARLGEIAISVAEATGLVLDLRAAGGALSETGLAAAAAVGNLGIPLVALVGRGTWGAAEVLVSELRRKGAALTIGEPTRGLPYGWRELALANGDRLLVPHPGETGSVAGAPAGPFRPDVEVAGAGSAPDGGGHHSPVPEQDAALLRALDVLTAVRAFGSLE